MSGLIVDVSSGFRALGVEQRLADTPRRANTRGLFFRLAEQAVAARANDLLETWRAVSGARPRWPFRMYSTRDFIREQATAAVLLSPEDPGVALRSMWATTTKLSPLIRAEGFIQYLVGRDPMQALGWLERNRSMMCDYGDWWVIPKGNRAASFHYVDEYTWIEHCHVGGVEGMLRRCGVSATVAVALRSPYRGELQIEWE